MHQRGFVAALLTVACAAPPPRTSLPHGAAPLRVERVEFLGEIHAGPARDARVLLQDGAIPTPLTNGTLWTFGDTFLGTRDDDGTVHWAGDRSNTMAFLPAGAHDLPLPLSYLRGADGSAAPPLQLLADEDPKRRRLWPLAGVQIGARTYLFYGLVDLAGEGPWGFRVVGTGLARAESPLGPYERLPQTTTAPWPIDPSSIVRSGEHLLLFAPRPFHGEQDPRRGLCIARVAEAAIERTEAYEFFAGHDARGEPRWSRNAHDAIAAADDVAGQASVAWNECLRGFLLATSCDLSQPRSLRLRFAVTPFGPYVDVPTPAGARIELPERTGERTQLVYCAMLHPELDRDGGRVVTLTCCRMLQRPWALTNPECVRVTFAAN